MEIAYWNRVGGVVESIESEEKTYRYRVAPFTQWKVIIAEDDIDVKKGRPVVIRIKDIHLPENTIIGPLSIMRHAYGSVVDVFEEGIPKKVEEKKRLTHTIFLPVDNGVIRSGDLIGVLKVFFVKVGTISRRLGFSAGDIKLREEIVRARMVYRDDGNIYRDEIKTKFFGYFRSHIAEWEPLIADENVEIGKGEMMRINIKEIDLPPNTVVTPLHIMRHALGTVVDVVQLERPRKVEEEKKVTQAIFIASRDGRIERGDLLGVMNVYYVATGDLKLELRDKKATIAKIAYEKNGRMVRKGLRLQRFAYRRKPIARWELLISDEERRVSSGRIEEIRIKPLQIEANTILYPLYIMRNPFGTVIDIIQEGLKKVEEERVITGALFLPAFDGLIKRGQLLGVVNVYSVEVKPHEVLRKWFNEWTEEMRRIHAQVV